MEPGGILLLRDHDASTEDLKKIADMAHRFFNVLTGVDPESEINEIRNFESLEYFIRIIEKSGFKLASEPLTRKDDPTNNCLIKFYKPFSEDSEGQIGLIREKLINACNQRAQAKMYTRRLIASSFSRVEWFNVESEKALSNFYENNSFWKYPHIRDAKETLIVYGKSFVAASKVASVREVFTSDYNLMNSTILMATSIQNISRSIFNTFVNILSIGGVFLPDREDVAWQAPAAYYAKWMKEYSNSLEVIPSYEHPYAQKLNDFFKTLNVSYTAVRQNRSIVSLITDKQTYRNLATAVSITGDLLWRQMFASIVKSFYGGEENGDAREIGLIVKSKNTLNTDTIFSLAKYANDSIAVEGNSYKGLIVPRYQQLTEVLGILSNEDVEIIEIAGQRSIEIEFSLIEGESLPEIAECKELYRRQDLSKADNTIVAYSVPVKQIGTVFKLSKDKIHRLYDY